MWNPPHWFNPNKLLRFMSHHHHQSFNVLTTGTQASSLEEGMSRNPSRGPSADWRMSHVFEFLVLGHAGFLTMFSFTVLRTVVMK